MYKEKVDLEYYIFDWDDNILHMSTMINMEEYCSEMNKWIPISVSTNDFVNYRKDPRYRIPMNMDNVPDYEFAYMNFTDMYENDHVFFRDSIIALKRKSYGVSYTAFKQCIINGSLFSIITARGHRPSIIRKVIRYIITDILTDSEQNEMVINLKKYLDIYVDEYSLYYNTDDMIIDHYLESCTFIGISSESFKESLKDIGICKMNVISPEMGKEIAVKRFVQKCTKHTKLLEDKNILGTASIGFSDDDNGNVDTITELFKNELKNEFPKVKFVLYNTSNNEYKKMLI